MSGKRRSRAHDFKFRASAIVVVIGFLFVAACSPRGHLRTLPVPAERAAKLTVIRLSDIEGAGNTWVVSVDDQEVLGLRSGEHATVTVPAGDRIITSDCVRAYITRPGKPLRVRVQVGGHHYVTLGACALMEVTEMTAIGLMAESRRIE
jgi:hypothetical protein